MERTHAGFRPIIALLAGLAVLSGLVVSIRSAVHRSSPWVLAVIATMLIWGARLVWLFLGFPKALLPAEFFDASQYGAPFLFGLTSSPGETLLSSLALLATIIALFSASGRSGSVSYTGNAPSLGGRFASGGAVVFSTIVALVLTRAYGAAVRSFVVDSSIRYDEPSTLVPDPVVLVMLGSLLCLTLGLILAYAMMIRLVRWFFDSTLKARSRSPVPWVMFFGFFALLGLGYAEFLATPQVPLVLSVGLAIAVTILLRRFDEPSVKGGSRRRSLAGISLVLSFVSFGFAAPVLSSKIEEKTDNELLWVARELVRPAGSWLPFVLADGLQQIIEQSEYGRANGLSPGQQNAFDVWARTLMSREGYNSAVILYDPAGNEVDRFSVGLTNYEQSELLQVIFELDEEVPRSFERRQPGGEVRYYGTWGTLRSDRGEVTGYVALMLSAAQRSFFRGEVSERLGPLGNTGVSGLRADVVYAEYIEGVVESSNTPELYPGKPLEESVRARLDLAGAETFLGTETVGEKDIQFAYVADETTEGRDIAVGVEAVGIRWRIFNAIRLLIVFLVFTGVVLLVDALRRRDVYRPLVLGFRGKLALAFLLFTVVPLLVLGYYNREFTIERIEAGIARDLAESLTLIERRVGDFVDTEEDFVRGITNDFCDGIANEFGIDFSVFIDHELHSSSRPELYQTEILSPRLNGTAYAAVGLLGRTYYQDVERIGQVGYAVGYAPFRMGDRLLGILSVPTLYRQAELEEELAQRNAFVLSVYGVILVVVLVIGILTANALSRPVHDLTEASRRVARGDLDVSVVPKSRDEIGELVQSFNEMVRDLKASRSELARAERESAWKEMAKQVAHEIKNPLTPMKLSMQHLRQALADRARNLDDIISGVTKTVMEQIDTLARIASEFSHFARMPERRFERCDVHSLLADSVELFRHIEGIEIRTKFSDTSMILVADKDELRRVFVNVLRNSVQAMDRGGTIAVETEHVGSEGVIRFRDTGAGIPEALRSKVFQPNFSTKTEGMGLGLAMSQRIVVDLNGRIELDSAVGKGTTVVITLPLAI
jgi:signal transduction histidine kinase